MVRSPLAREMLVAGLIAAVGVLARQKNLRSAADKLGEGAKGAAADTIDIASRIGQAIASAAHRFYPEQHADRIPTDGSARTIPTEAGAMPHVA